MRRTKVVTRGKPPDGRTRCAPSRGGKRAAIYAVSRGYGRVMGDRPAPGAERRSHRLLRACGGRTLPEPASASHAQAAKSPEASGVVRQSACGSGQIPPPCDEPLQCRRAVAPVTPASGPQVQATLALRRFELKSRRYLGCKAGITRFIHNAITRTCGSFDSFCDPFAGTGTVSQVFNSDRMQVISNDHLFSNYVALHTFLKASRASSARLAESIAYLNSLPADADNYFSMRYGGTFFTRAVARKIGIIRDKIEVVAADKSEKYALICSLLYAMDRLANTVGHYDAYRRSAASSGPLDMRLPHLEEPYVNAKNRVYSMDANDLVRKISADVLYLDPPYNSRQYCDAYHLLENTAVWRKPETRGKAQKMDRSCLKSRYCLKDAAVALDDLIMHADCKYIFLSYNNTSNMRDVRSNSRISDKDLKRILEKRGRVTVHITNHREFSAGKTDLHPRHAERLFACEVN